MLTLLGNCRPPADTHNLTHIPGTDRAPLSAKLLKNATLKIYPGFPHGMLTTHADVINQDLLAFVRS